MLRLVKNKEGTKAGNKAVAEEVDLLSTWTDLWQIGEGQDCCRSYRVPAPSDSQAQSGHFSNTRKKEKIPVDNRTYMEQSENITSKGEPDD
ncbi:hypothetical protein [Rhizobium leguminosarum]|nr:hypothetical protein [Rhizobium leguminosarum]